MKILVTGLCTLHWGRLQYGNIGNYYIIEPLFRELHRVFPSADIVTTFQMTDEFIEKENITVLPMELYYSWSKDDVEKAKYELKLAKEYSCRNSMSDETQYIECLQTCDMIINVSGDMWGDNAEHVGEKRFLVDLLKMRTAQLLGVKTVLFAGTPGPFTDEDTIELAKEVFSHFDMVINREPTSTINIKKWGFPTENTKNFACPAFLYEPILTEEEEISLEKEMQLIKGQKPLIGFTIGGFNMPVPPYDMWPRSDVQYEIFAAAVEHIVNTLNARVVLISHTNGFELPPNFKLINGRDYPILKQLQEVVLKRGIIKNPEDVVCIEQPHLPKMTKSIIGRFDMLITGRVHASVAGISQHIPTVFINYDKNVVESTKMYGFSSLASVGELVSDPDNLEQLCQKIDYCWREKENITNTLKESIRSIKKLAREAFDEIAKI